MHHPTVSTCTRQDANFIAELVDEAAGLLDRDESFTGSFRAEEEEDPGEGRVPGDLGVDSLGAGAAPAGVPAEPPTTKERMAACAKTYYAKTKAI